MKLGPMAEYYAKMIWRTSDTPGFKLFWLTQKYDAYFAVNVLMKEYIYLKAGIVARLIHLSSAKANKTDAEPILTAVEQKLKMLYNSMPNKEQYTWGSNYNELIERINDYMSTLPSEDLSAVESLFVACLSEQRAEYGELIQHIGPSEFVKDVEGYMLDKMVKHENKYGENGNPADAADDGKIESELMANVVADAIWSTDDYGTSMLAQQFGKDPVVRMTMRDIVREYMYLKAAIAARLVYEAAGNEQDYNTIMGQALGILRNVYSTNPPGANDGKYSELVGRMNGYLKAEDSDETARMFSKNLYWTINLYGGSDRLLNNIASPWFIDGIEKSMRRNFIQFQKNNSGYNSGSKSGCLSVVACVPILAIILLAFVCF